MRGVNRSKVLRFLRSLFLILIFITVFIELPGTNLTFSQSNRPPISITPTPQKSDLVENAHLAIYSSQTAINTMQTQLQVFTGVLALLCLIIALLGIFFTIKIRAINKMDDKIKSLTKTSNELDFNFQQQSAALDENKLNLNNQYND